MAEPNATSGIDTASNQRILAPGNNGGTLANWPKGVSGNPAGKPKGSRHLRTVIQELMEDDKFEVKLKNGEVLKGMPSRNIAEVMYKLAISGNTKAADWLARNGYPTEKEAEPAGNTYNTQVNIDNSPRGQIAVDAFAEFMMQQTLPKKVDNEEVNNN